MKEDKMGGEYSTYWRCEVHFGQNPWREEKTWKTQL